MDNNFFDWWEEFTDLVYKTNYDRGLEKEYYRDMFESKNKLTPQEAVDELLRDKFDINK